MNLKNLLKKYKHIWTALYALIYLPWFYLLEQKVTTDFNLIHLPIDDKIPFCEYFIIPYYLWFIYVAVVFVYMFLYSPTEYYKFCALLFTGMTAFLIICTVWPNGLNLRPDLTGRDNIFAKMVAGLYKTDTSTNVFPSMHVFNTLGCLIALLKSKGLKNKPVIKGFAIILSISIVLSTMFLKQHSVVDVIGGFVLATVLYLIVYVPNWEAKFSKKVGNIVNN